MPLTRKPLPVTTAAPLDATAVLQALEHGTHEERWAAARSAGDLPGGVTALARTLPRESNIRVREAMFTSLARVRTDESFDILVSLLRLDDANLRTGALGALATAKDILAARLPGLLKDRDPDVRLLACELARSLPSNEASLFLCQLLTSETEDNVCGAAVEVLIDVGGVEALSVLARCADTFCETPFLLFSIKAAIDRIRSQSNVTSV